MSRGLKPLVVFVLLGAGALAPTALAAEPKAAPARELDAAKSIDIHAEHLDLDLAARTAKMTGNVTITRGSLELRCPHVDVRYDEGKAAELRVTWLKGAGGVVASVNGVRAEAPEVELDVGAQTMALKGGVRMTRGEGWITADRATVELKTGKVSMTDVKGSLPVGSSDAPLAPPRSPEPRH
jgi:lipopolysaccharide export system protein LptA